MLEPGSVVGDYQVIRPLDGGSFLGSREGLTVTLVPVADDSFRHAGGGLDHPAIAAVYDVFQYRGAAYVAREHVAGGSLRAWIGRTTPAQAAGALDAALAGLAHAHAHGVVHGDVRPESLLVTEAGEVKLAGFTGRGDAEADVQAVRGLARELFISPPAEITAWMGRLPPDARVARNSLETAAQRALGPEWREPLLERDPTGEFLTYQLKAASRPPTSESAELRALDAVVPQPETEHLEVEVPEARTVVQPRVEPPREEPSYSVYARGGRTPVIAAAIVVVVLVVLAVLLLG